MKPFYSQIQPENLPMPDQGIMAVIRYALKEDADFEILGRLISVNPALTIQLLGLVNSAFFGFRERISSIPHALTALGLKQIRSLVLCFAVKETFAEHSIPGFDINGFWTDSVRRGAVARELARMAGESDDEAFSAGMLLDIGLLALFFLEPAKADRWPLLRPNLPEDRRRMEKSLFRTTHDRMGGLLAAKWGLPQAYVDAIQAHHTAFDRRRDRPDGPSPLGLPAIIHLADLCNAVYTCHDKARALTLVEQRGRQLFGLDAEEITILLSRLPDLVETITGPMAIQPGPQTDFNTIMSQAGQKLVEDNITYRELTWKLQHSLKQRDEYAHRLQTELGVAREIQKSLQPEPGRFPQIAAFNLAAYHLSGDFYDFFHLPSGDIGFCIGDVSGKGTAAALLMAKAISLFRCLCKLEEDMGRVVEMMNTELYETAVRGMFVTFAGGRLDPERRQAALINMGHVPPMLIRAGKITRVNPAGPPLGVLPQASPVAQPLDIAGSRLVLYTDGFTEGKQTTAEEKNAAPLGFKGFLRWLVQSGDLPIREQTRWMQEKCREKLSPRSDDLTLMILSGEDDPAAPGRKIS
ncbi:MAG: HDOD domain-containing protein [Desulfobacter sp.]|nr:MAG: HDOD domain-containing protein [Desulfobacter sp.]